MTSAIIRPLVLAWHFLTVIRLSRTLHEATPRELARSMSWYPLVGVLLGAILVAVDRALSLFLAPVLVDVLLVVVLVTITGGLHQDGLADTLDGIGGGDTAAERLRIMRDPHIGAIGATGLVLDIVLRVGGLQAIPDDIRTPVLLCVPTFGRWALVIGSWGAHYARAEGGVAGPFLAALSWQEVASATAITLAVALWQVGWLAMLVCSGVTIVLARGVSRGSGRLCDGITGDVLGAVNELVEIAVLILLPLVWAMS